MSCREAELARLAEEAWRQILPFHDGELSGQLTPAQMAAVAFDYAEAFLAEREYRDGSSGPLLTGYHTTAPPPPSVGIVVGDEYTVSWQNEDGKPGAT